MVFRLSWVIASILAAFLGLGTAGLAQQPAETRMLAAFEGWMASNDVTAGAIVVLKNGTPVLSQGIGMAVDQPVELASLSKAITGACVAQLAGKGILPFDSTLGQVLGWQGNLGKITIAQLLTHTSGLAQDRSQGLMGQWLGNSAPAWGKLGKVVQQKSKVGSKTYRYNNDNYALLALAIEAATGKGYVQACGPVLSASSSARLSAQTGAFAPWGGWQMTLADYGQFLLRQVKPNLRKAPFADLGNGARYGAGILWRSSGNGVNLWHHGRHCFPGRLNAGSFAASWNGPYAVVVAYQGCVSDAAQGALDDALAKAALSGG